MATGKAQICLLAFLPWLLMQTATPLEVCAQSQEKAILVKDTSQGQLVNFVIGKTFGQAMFKTEEAGEDSRAHIIALSPTWEVVYYDPVTKKQYLTTLNKMAAATATCGLKPDPRKATKAGKWNGLNLLKIIVEGTVADESIMSYLCPTKDDGQEKLAKFEYYYTDSMKLSGEQEKFIKGVFAEVLGLAPVGFPLGLRALENGRPGGWTYKVMNLEEKIVDRSRLKYPTGYVKCFSLDAINFDKERMESIESMGESMNIGGTMHHSLKKPKKGK